jgi:hypothetical protein
LAAYGTFRKETNFLGYGAERTFARPRLETVLDPVQTFLGFCVDTTSLGPNRNSYRFICLSGTASTIIGFKPACRVAQSVETDRFRIVDILFGVIWPTGGSKNLSVCESIPDALVRSEMSKTLDGSRSARILEEVPSAASYQAISALMGIKDFRQFVEEDLLCPSHRFISTRPPKSMEQSSIISLREALGRP